MKRTIEEVMDLLEQKRENAKNMLDGIRKQREKDWKAGRIACHNLQEDVLKGEYDAYTDVICLIASSHLLEKGEQK